MTPLIAKNEGFTLAEAMMSLLVVGLALGGLIQVASQTAKAQARIAAYQKQTKIADQQAAIMEAVLAKLASDTAAAFIGRSDYLSARDQAGRDQSYRPPRGWRLSYISEGETFDQWPRQIDENLTGEHPRLEAVVLKDAKGAAVFVVRMRLEQAVDCQFDMISRRCREAG